MTFTVYSKKGCPFCDKVKVVLNELSIKKGYPIICYELGTQFTREEFYAEFGEGSTFPQVVFDKKNIGGCSDTVKYLQENNMF